MKLTKLSLLIYPRPEKILIHSHKTQHNMTYRILPVLGLCIAMLASCSKKDTAAPEDNSEALAAASKQELQAAVNDRDQLLSLMNEIQTSLNEIKNLEKIVSVNGAETPDQREQIKRDIAAIQQTLIDKQARLDELEKKLSSSNLYTANLQKTITSLREQIDQQNQEISRLNDELASANQKIANLGNQVDSLNTTVTNVTDERNAAQQQNVELAGELNTCYVAIGSTKELKENKIIEKQFLRSTKVMESDFNQAFFQKKDKRTLTTINLYSKKAQVLTKQPTGSYTITDVNGQKVLTITNPEKFWSLTDYLVIKTD